MRRSTPATTRRYHIRAVERALTVLKLFLTADESLSASEISNRSGLDPTTAFRLLVTLESKGFCTQEPATGRYRLGMACLELGSHYLETNDLRASAVSAMEALRSEFGETVHLCALDDGEVVYLEKLPGLHPIGLMSSSIGRRAPAYCTGVGKVLLAYAPDEELARFFSHTPLECFTPHTITTERALRRELANIRKKRYAVDDEEHEPGVKCIAVPIAGHNGVVAALSIAGPAERMEEHIATHGLVERIQEIAQEIPVPLGESLSTGLFNSRGARVPARPVTSIKTAYRAKS